MKRKILFGIPPKNHVLLSKDEIDGLGDIGYSCRSVVYGNNNQTTTKLNKFWGVLTNAFRLLPELYKFSPDILYLNSRFEPVASTRDFISLLIIRLLYLRKMKIVIKSHGSLTEFVATTSFFHRRFVLPFLTRNVDVWFFLSNQERQTILQHRPDLENKVFVTTNIIDPSRSVQSAAFRKRYQLDDNKFKILFVGRIVEEKGVFNILESISLLDFRENCSFIFVGSGPDFERLKQRAKELNVEKYVRLTGFIEDQECDHFYANADILLFPTFDSEGFPMALFKSVAAGLPVITTYIRAAKDHLVAPDNVLWIKEQHPEGIAQAITTLYNNETMRKKMSQSNRLIGRKFSRKQVCEEMDEVIAAI